MERSQLVVGKDGKKLVSDVGCGDAGDLGVIVGRGDFDDIRRCQVNSLKTTDDRANLASGPATSLWGTSGRSECRIDCVNVD